MELASTMSFPIVAFIRKSIPCLIKDVHHFSIWPVSTFEKGLLGMMIVDSKGSEYVVCSATKKGYPKPFFGFSLLCKRSLLVDIKVSNTDESMSLEGFKALLSERVVGAFPGEVDPEQERLEIESFLAGCESVEEVIEAYARYLGLERTKRSKGVSPN